MTRYSCRSYVQVHVPAPKLSSGQLVVIAHHALPLPSCVDHFLSRDPARFRLNTISILVTFFPFVPLFSPLFSRAALQFPPRSLPLNLLPRRSRRCPRPSNSKTLSSAKKMHRPLRSLISVSNPSTFNAYKFRELVSHFLPRKPPLSLP